MAQKTIYIINGPNLNLLGRRETEIYGNQDFDSYLAELKEKFPSIHLEYFQTNHEGLIIDKLHNIGFSSDGVVINAGAYTHTSIAIRDAIKGIESPCVEVHISDIAKREDFRKHSYLTEVCVHHVIGKGLAGYEEAIEYLIAETSV